MPLVNAIPSIGGKPGTPLSKPQCVLGDRAYDCEAYRSALRARGIKPLLAKRYTEHGSGLGTWRWPIERTISWLHQFRRLRVRYDRRADVHEAFLQLACCVICWRKL
jgi:transposase